MTDVSDAIDAFLRGYLARPGRAVARGPLTTTACVAAAPDSALPDPVRLLEVVRDLERGRSGIFPPPAIESASLVGLRVSINDLLPPGVAAVEVADRIVALVNLEAESRLP